MSGTETTVVSLELRNAALSAIRRGWPVVPGTFLGADRRWHGRADAAGLCPISEAWQDTPVTTPEHAEEIWSQHPYAVLLVCGQGVDVLELPNRMMGLLSIFTGEGPVVPVPVAVTGSLPRFLVFTSTDVDFLLPALPGVRLHGAGSWIALPPTPTELVLAQRWWTTPLPGQPLLPPQVVCDALRSAGAGWPGDEQE
jgi:Bifunctional DNA primase/polymerase, N-terminal